MAEISNQNDALSQGVIDKMLDAISARNKGVEDSGGRKIMKYDFKCPCKLLKEQLDAITTLCDRYSLLLISSLSEKLQMPVRISRALVDELTYDQFIRMIPTSSVSATLAAFGMEPLKGHSVIQISQQIIAAGINQLRLRDNSGGKKGVTALAAEFIMCMLENLSEAWSPLISKYPDIVQIETNPQFIRVAQPSDSGIWILLGAKIGDTEGEIDLFIPYNGIKPIIGALSNAGIAVAKDVKTAEPGSAATESSMERKACEPAAECTVRICSFNDIVMLDECSMWKVIREVDSQELAKALKSAAPEVQNKFFGTLGEKNANNTREDMEDMGPVYLREVEEAQYKIVLIAQHLENAGVITYNQS